MKHLTCISYRIINKDSGKKLKCVVSIVIKSPSVDDSIKKKFTPNNFIMPWIYGAPKIQKDGVPLIQL